MLVLLNLMVGNYYELQIANNKLSEDIVILLIRMTLWAFLFGVLMEWKGLEKLINRKFNMNWKLLIPTIVLSIFAFIPNQNWVLWFGISETFFPTIFWLPETHIVLSVLAGTMSVRSLVEK